MKIAVLTPVHGSPRAGYTRSLARMLLRSAKERADSDIRYWLAEGHLLANRNDLAREALNWGADFTLWIDADMEFPETALLDLLRHDLDVVAANYPARQQPPVPTAHRDQKNVYTLRSSTGVEEVHGIGLGLALIRTSVLQALGSPVFIMDPNDRYPGEDKHLCARLLGAGVKIHIDHDLSKQVRHIVEHPYTHDVVEAFARREGLIQPG